MRTYGRALDPSTGNLVWFEVDTDAQGFNDYVYVTALVQTIKLNLGESPFYASFGIPYGPTLVSQVFPDYYMAKTQGEYAPFFASLLLNKIAATDARGVPYPAYDIKITTHQGVKIAQRIPV